MARDLAELLDIQINLATNIIPENLRSDSVRERLKAMMDVIEEALKFITARMNDYSPGKPRVSVVFRSFLIGEYREMDYKAA